MSKKIIDMTPDMVGGRPYTTHRLKYYDGVERTVLVVDEEVPYPDGRMIVSRTDIDGVITHANQAFVDISGWSRDELIGSQHYILRHPDIPGPIFKTLWDSMEEGKPWFGYVKNLRRDGRYYWVYASVNPSYRDGTMVALTSVRRKPAREKVNETADLVAKINSGEIKL